MNDIHHPASFSRASASLCLCCAISLFASPASAVTIAWVPVGNPGNASDPNTGSLYGAVAYNYSISKYDVTNSQYVEFLNAKDPNGTNVLGLYDSQMSDSSTGNIFSGHGGIAFTPANPAGSKYSVIAPNANHPVNYVSWYDALRFANWLNNGQGNGDTESGAYALLGGTPTPSNASSITRSAGATIFLTSQNEWYKAAYYDPRTTAQGGPPANSHYWLYPTTSNTAPTAEAPPGGSNSANINQLVGDMTDVGAYMGTGAITARSTWEETCTNGTKLLVPPLHCEVYSAEVTLQVRPRPSPPSSVAPEAIRIWGRLRTASEL
jgi:sulfatase modifying factor 1